MSSKITHLKTHGDGWWLNKAVDADGKPRGLGLGLVTLAAGGTRFVDAKTVARSGGAFRNAEAAGLITGPFASQAEALGGVKATVKEPVREPEDVVEPVVEAEPVVEPVKEPEDSARGGEKKLKKR